MQLTGGSPWLLAEITAGTTIWDGGSPFVTWGVQFLATLALELPMVLLAWRFRGATGRLRPWLIACVLGNLVSHPLAVLVATSVDVVAGGGAAITNYMLIETGVILIEAGSYRLLATRSWGEAALYSLTANAVTALLGAEILFGL